MEFYKGTNESVVKQLNSNDKDGLDEKAITASRKSAGSNQLIATNTRSFLKILGLQFVSPLIIILIVASYISFYLGQPRDGSILFIIVFCNAMIGFYQEWKSENILASLKSLVVKKCTVIRSEKKVEILVDDLVPGDIVVLHEGDGVPADIRLMDSDGFAANEFIMTGESVPSDKDHLFNTEKSIPIGEMKNCVFMGTTVARGNAKGVVYATGMQTEIGRISTSSEKIKVSDAPVQIEITDVAKKLTYATLLIGAILFITRLLFHDSLTVALVFAVSVAAAMVPEGLPAQISVALALAVSRLAKKNAIVKKMSAAQTLGSATVIATDKTGTITKNEMTITGCQFNGNTFTVSGLGYEPKGEILNDQARSLKKDSLDDMKVFFLSGFLSSTGRINPPDTYHKFWYSIGDPTEASFATLVLKAGFTLEEIEKDYPIVKSFGFNQVSLKAAIIRSHKGKVISFVKGSLETVLDSCPKIILNGEVVELKEDQRKQITESAATFAADGLRMIALAYKDLETKKEYTVEEAESDLIFAGFVSMFDPPHEEVLQAIESVFKAHMKVYVITGDNEITAKAIAKKIGLMNENDELPQVINGSALKDMSDKDICALFVKRAIIFSRVAPEDKLRIVDLLKKQGEVVAVTGDGVNDTLSLKRADIGVAMGKNGSKVAQEAANMILLDDNFSTIVLAVKEGRTIFRNLEKTIKTNLSSNVAELACVLFGFIGAFAGVATPILAMQILLIDMVGEMFPLIMLTYDPPEKTIMEMAPRNPKDKILTKDSMKGIAFSGLLMAGLAYAAFLVEFIYLSHLSNHYEKALTVTFISIIFGQYANLLSRRTYGSVFSSYLFANRNLLIAFAFSVSCILLLVYVPVLNLYCHTSSLNLIDWLLPIAAGGICLLVFEWRKKIKMGSVQ